MTPVRRIEFAISLALPTQCALFYNRLPYSRLHCIGALVSASACIPPSPQLSKSGTDLSSDSNLSRLLCTRRCGRG